ncbi:metallophosphoesterase [Marinilabilia rubra]|uniref:Metallophosphoesterase n=1 Tax=Marinilabilia rubra TaxID=2162893 RepID=A0A2U2BAT0_9BACT|nr:metallophosphoesterase [Marinilabilia rubra]PWE00171.1 metallophosphoesterase [Marinilabilia rubra]
MLSKIIDKTLNPGASASRPAKRYDYDIIGDVHGYANELEILLKQMDYREINGVYLHDDRKAVFVGDFTCRGPETRRAINIVRNMVEHETGYAILGNHELNAIANFTKSKEWKKPFKQATGSSKKVMDRIREEYIYDKAQLKTDIKWLRQLPFSLDFGKFRVVHAYWSDEHLNLLKESRKRGKLTKRVLSKMFAPDTKLAMAMRQTTRGIELNLPHDLLIKDHRNIRRTNFRMKWWDSPKEKTFEQVSYGNKFTLPHYTIPREVLPVFDVYPTKAPVVFMGHYCVEQKNMIPAANVCCVDNCAANGGYLAAYRWNGELPLKLTNFVFQKKLVSSEGR